MGSTLAHGRNWADEGRPLAKQLASHYAGCRNRAILDFDDKPVVSSSGLVGGTILSRLGLRGLELCVQLIVQEVRTG